eukprot:65427-Chlamydomonas_euryale.AAC.1
MVGSNHTTLHMAHKLMYGICQTSNLIKLIHVSDPRMYRWSPPYIQTLRRARLARAGEASASCFDPSAAEIEAFRERLGIRTELPPELQGRPASCGQAGPRPAAAPNSDGGSGGVPAAPARPPSAHAMRRS